MPGLIVHPGQIWLVVEPVDMRRGIDGLSMIVQQALARSPCAGSAFVFGNRIKVLLWDGTGIWLCQRRLDYTLKLWPSLVRYAQSGHLPIDNNPVENAIRPIVLGKKNWLFTGLEHAGQRAATIQTLFGTAQLNGLNPSAWLKDTLIKLPAWPNNRIDELLPLTPELIKSLS